MKELSIKEKAIRYDEVIEKFDVILNLSIVKESGTIFADDVRKIFPELKENEDERIRKSLIGHLKECRNNTRSEVMLGEYAKWIDWLEKHGEQKSCMIQWKGDNLKEVIDFTGKDKNFEKWFKSFEEYEKYVHEHNDIFKLFNEDGSHYEVPVGAWIVKTPDGYNVASKAVLKQKPTEWSEEDETFVHGLIRGLTAKKDIHGHTTFSSDCIDITKTINWLGSLKDRVQFQYECYDDEGLDTIADRFIPESTWNALEESKGEGSCAAAYDYSQMIAMFKAGVQWLKSLKERYTWKPSDEQMGALDEVYKTHSANNVCRHVLFNLMNDLKKLREE